MPVPYFTVQSGVVMFGDIFGPPDMEFRVPGPIATRPSGRPWQSQSLLPLETEIRAFEAQPSLQDWQKKRLAKMKRRLTKARSWNAYHTFRDAVRYHAHRSPTFRRFEGPVFGVVVFTFERPKSHYGTGRNAGVLKASAPKAVTVKPDSKNLRFLFEDALNPHRTWPGLWKDDAYVELFPYRIYGPKAGVNVKLWEVLES